MRVLWLVAGLLALAAACTDDGAPSPTPGPTQQTAAQTATPTPVDDLCPLLSGDDIVRTLGVALNEALPHNAPPLHFCTFYLDIPGCEDQCALSLEYLGPPNEANNSTSDSFRDAFESVNPEANFEFQDDIFGDDSWLAVAESGNVPQWKVVYFQVNGIAYDLHGPLVTEYALTEQQIIDVVNTVIDHLAERAP